MMCKIRVKTRQGNAYAKFTHIKQTNIDEQNHSQKILLDEAYEEFTKHTLITRVVQV